MGHSPNEKDDFRMTGRPEAKFSATAVESRCDTVFSLAGIGQKRTANFQGQEVNVTEQGLAIDEAKESPFSRL